jgi:hypothetical protein
LSSEKNTAQAMPKLQAISLVSSWPRKKRIQRAIPFSLLQAILVLRHFSPTGDDVSSEKLLTHKYPRVMRETP